MDGSDIGWYLSSSGASEGGAMSATPITSAVDNNVFPDVSSSSRIAGGTMIRKVFLANDHATDDYIAHAIWISTAPSHSTGYIGLGFDDADDDETDAGALTTFSGAAKVSLRSDAADTRAVDVYGLVGGTPTKETMTLNGAAEVLSTATFDAGGVYALHTTVSGSRIITIKEGAGGTTRGIIGIGYSNIFLWITAASKSVGLWLPLLAAGSGDGIWQKVVWSAAAIAGPQDLPLATEAL
jgi:hypothetical protein